MPVKLIKLLKAVRMFFKGQSSQRAEYNATLQIRKAVAISTQKVAENAKVETDELVRKIQESRRNESTR